jgi:hypothetical protein
VVEHLPSKLKVPNSTPQYHQIKKIYKNKYIFYLVKNFWCWGTQGPARAKHTPYHRATPWLRSILDLR